MLDPRALESARAALAAARRVAVVTGAGISAESGVPTFRGAGGLWRNFQATDLATPEAFARDPRLVWEWYDWRRGLVAACHPNAGHHALASLAERVPELTLITQNVDGLHQLAGSRDVLALHGDIWTIRCTGCGARRLDRTHPLSLLPYCAACGALERPHIVWFGEALDPEIIGRAALAAARAEVLLVVGTSGVVYPAASLAYECKRNGGFVIVVNLEATEQSADMDLTLLGPSGEVLPQLVDFAAQR
jgi:NAD-dependent deacetylase